MLGNSVAQLSLVAAAGLIHRETEIASA
jgi:hypothetical protein